jgi:outer membrane protein assembly factor BamB
MRKLSYGLAAAALLASPAAATAQTADMFRGDAAHHGVYAGGGATIQGLQWRVATHGDVVSSPVVSGGTVYVGSGDGTLYAIDLASGRVAWTFDAGGPIASSPAVAQGLVFVGTRAGVFLAVDARSGAARWRLATGADLPLPWGHESGDVYTSSPTYADGVVVFGAGDGNVYAVDAATGAVRWRAPTGGRVRSSPAVAGGAVYVGSFDGGVYAFDLRTGRQRWRFATAGDTLHSEDFGYDRRSVQSSPAVDQGVVFVGARDGFVYAIDAATGTLKWRFDHHISWINSSPAVAGDVVYDGSSDAHMVQALDAATGRELWRLGTDVPVWSSPAVTDSQVYFGDWAGRVHVADRRSGKDVAVFRTGGGVFGSPVISGGLLIVGSADGAVYALRLGNAAPVTRVVFFDSTYRDLAHVGAPKGIADYFVHRGYTVVDAPALGQFLRDRLADHTPSVLVFAMDVLPPDLATAPPGASPLRRYLEAGGKVVWVGVPPLLWQPDFANRRPLQLKDLDWARPGDLLGVPHDAAIFDQRGVHATPDGLQWGLPERWRDGWGIAPAGVTEVLGLDEWGLASSWVRSYGGPRGTGFVRAPEGDLLALYLVAEYRPGSS